MNLLSVQNVDFSFDAHNSVFKNLSVEFGNESPVMILGTSGCGKTSLLHLLAGLLKPSTGNISGNFNSTSLVFQEPRLLPWKTSLENVKLPLVHVMGKQEAGRRAMEMLKLVSMENKADTYPEELSGGQKQRLNLARAFAFPCNLLLMDEPFQSQDIPLRIELMELTRSLLETPFGTVEDSSCLSVIVTHDPREAVYLGKRIIVLGRKPNGIIYDELLDLPPEDRSYGSAAQGLLERKLLELMRESG